MPVLRIVRKTNGETIETLEWMLQEAKRGKLNEFFGAFRDREGEHVAATGIYRAHPSRLLRALVRLQMDVAFEESTFS